MTRKFAFALVPALIIAAFCIAVLTFSAPGTVTVRDHQVGAAPAAAEAGRHAPAGGPAPRSTEGKKPGEASGKEASSEEGTSAEKLEPGKASGPAGETAGTKAGAAAKTAKASEKAAPGSKPERVAATEGKDKTAGAKRFPNEAPARDPGDKDPHMTGLKPLTKEELDRERRNNPPIRKIKLNKLGLQRMNAERKKKGLRPLSAEEAGVVPVGREVVRDKPGAAGGSAAPKAAPQAAPALPASLDNSTLKYWPPIRSQGGLGSCGSFSGTYYTMTHMYALAHDLDAKNGGDSLRFSPKFTYNFVNGGANVGSWYYWCFNLAKKHGCVTWAQFPYDGSDYKTWLLNAPDYREAINKRFDEYGYVYNCNTDAGMEQVKQLLVNGYVVNYPTYINSWQYRAIGDDPATAADDAYVGKLACYWQNGTNGYHAMTVVGYNDDIWVDVNGDGDVDSGEKGAFRIANSWGTSWREGGYSWIAYDALKATSAVDGGPSAGRVQCWSPPTACWVTSRVSYRPKMVAKFTVNHLKRNQLRVHLGLSDTSTTTPATNWYPQYVLSFAGGAYAFDGSTTALDGTFYMDFTDILPPSGQNKRWYVGIYDSAAGDEAAISSFKLYKVTDGGDVEAGTAANTPKTADGSEQEYVWVDYTYEEDGNDPPTISNIANQSTNEDVAKGPVAFTVGDAETPAGDLVLTRASSNTALVPTANIVFGGAGANRTVTVTPAPDAHGTATITVTVTDGGGLSASDSFVLTVNPVNDAPTISNIANQSTNEDTPKGPIAFTIGDVETATGDLVLTKGSSNTALVPLDGIILGGAGANRTVTLIPELNKHGSATITITVTDGGALQASDSFVLTVNSVNDLPVISTFSPATPFSMEANTSQVFEVSAHDDDGDPLSYSWEIDGGGTGTVTSDMTYSPTNADIGAHTIKVTVSDGKGGTDSRTWNVTVAVSVPAIGRDTAALSPSCAQGQDAAVQTFEVWNAGSGGTLNYTTSDDAAWLSCAPAAGDSTGEHDTITVTYDTSGLAAGSHNATITIAAAGVANSPQTITVTLTVAAPAKSGGGGGGGGGGCSLAAGSEPLGWALPYLALAGGWLLSRLRRRRRG